MKFPEMHMSEGNGEGGSKYAKHDDKGMLVGVFRGDPVVYAVHWANKRSSVCGEFKCAACDAGDRAKPRFSVNIAVEEGGVWVSKIYEGGVSVYQQLKALADEGYNLETTRIKVVKTGTGLDTAYSVLPSAKALSDQEKKLIANVPLKDVRPPANKNAEPGSDG